MYPPGCTKLPHTCPINAWSTQPLYNNFYNRKIRQRSSDEISGLMKMNLKIMGHGFCEEHAQLGACKLFSRKGAIWDIWRFF
jgi:hypothetical protein